VGLIHDISFYRRTIFCEPESKQILGISCAKYFLSLALFKFYLRWVVLVGRFSPSWTMRSNIDVFAIFIEYLFTAFNFECIYGFHVKLRRFLTSSNDLSYRIDSTRCFANHMAEQNLRLCSPRCVTLSCGLRLRHLSPLFALFLFLTTLAVNNIRLMILRLAFQAPTFNDCTV